MTTELKTTVTAMQERLVEAETWVGHLEETADRLKVDGERRQWRMEEMWECIQIMENHSKRNNIRLIGLKEMLGTNRTLMRCIPSIKVEGIGIQAEAGFKIERVHRLLAPMPDSDRPPRPVLIRFQRQSVRDKIISAAKEKKEDLNGKDVSYSYFQT